MSSELPVSIADVARESRLLGAGQSVLAFDVGGTDTKAAIVDGDGRIIDVRRTPTPRGGSDPASDVVRSLAALATDIAERNRGLIPVAAGVSVPGLVDETTGIGLYSASIGWRDAAIRDMAAHALQLPIAFGHDVRAAGVAEHRLGIAAEFTDVMVVVIGTGIAGALILDGTPYIGGGYAGELGHSLSDPRGDVCVCGARGCLETISSASAISRLYAAATGRRVAGAREVYAAAQAGEAEAREIWERAIRALGEALARVSAVIAPEAIIIGGGLAQAGAGFFDPLESHLRALMKVSRRPVLLPARLGENAGLIGTALAARELSRRTGGGGAFTTGREGAP
jgi:glucokinase